MWFFMYACYLFSLLSLGMLGVVICQSFNPFYVLNASPMSFLILTSIVYLLTETLVIFFFVGTGVSVKEYVLEHHLPTELYKRMLTIKYSMYPPLMLNLLIFMTAFILYGAADTGKIPHWIYSISLCAGLIHWCYAKKLQHGAFKDNTRIILEMSGIKDHALLKVG